MIEQSISKTEYYQSLHINAQSNPTVQDWGVILRRIIDAKMFSCKYSTSNHTDLSFRIYKFASQFFLQGGVGEIDEVYLRGAILKDGVVEGNIIERVKWLFRKLEHIRSSSISMTRHVSNLKSSIEKILSRVEKSGRKFLSGFQTIKSREISEYLIEKIFGGKESYLGMRQFYESVRGAPQFLCPVIKDLRIQSERCANVTAEMIISRRHLWERYKDPFERIKCEQVIRCFIPDGVVLFEEILIDEKPFTYDQEGKLLMVQREFFFMLLQKCLKIDGDLRQELPVFSDVTRLLKGNPECNALKFLRLGTMGSWSIADMMLRTVFIPLNEAPFVMRPDGQGTKIFFNITDPLYDFSVTQQKKYVVGVRSRVEDLQCTQLAGDSIAVLTIEHKITYKEPAWTGELRICDVQVNEGASLYERRVVWDALAHPPELPCNWEESFPPPRLKEFSI